MAVGEIHLSDIGTVFEVTIKDGSVVVDVSGATTKQIIFQKPDGTKITKAAVFTTDGVNGKIEYVSVSGDLDTVGTWQLQGRVVIAAGDFHTDLSEFEVHENILRAIVLNAERGSYNIAGKDLTTAKA